MKDNERKYCVYKHTSPSGKVYIGITSKKPEERWGKNGSKYKKNQHFWNAIKKYGWDNFEHLILFENLTKKEACEIEISLISSFNSQDPECGYNISPGGDLGFTGCHFSAEVKQKLSESHKGLYVGDKNPMYGVSPKDRMDEETYNSWLEQTRARVSSDDFKEKMREINIGKKYSDETNKKKGRKGSEHPFYGKHHTNETKEKIRQANIGRKYSDEVNSKKGHKGVSNPSARAVEQYSKDGVFIKKWDYATLASKSLGIDLSSIIACCRGTNGRKTAGGFTWKYFNEEETENVKSACI